MINIYFGRAGSGKTYGILNEIAEKFNDDMNEKMILIVPEQYTLKAESELIKNINGSGIINFEVLSFNRLISKVISDMGGLKTVEINKLGKAMILRKIFEEKSDDLEVYGRAYKKIGFIREMGETISELKRGNISSENIFNLIKELPEETLSFKKLRDIGDIYSLYQKNMMGKFSDDEDKINYACEKILKWEPVVGAKVWIDGFSGFTEQEYKILEMIFSLANDVTIAMTMDNLNNSEEKIFENTHKTYKRLLKIAENAEKDVKFKNLKMNNDKNDIEHLEKNLFSYPYLKFQGKSSNLEIIMAYDMEMEIESIAHKIINLIIEKNYEWKDISIITTDVDSYKDTIERVFSIYNIPYFIDSKINVMGNSIIKFILLSLECVLQNFRQEKMIELLKTEYFNIDSPIINSLENYILQKGFRGSRWFRTTDGNSEDIKDYYLKKFTDKIYDFSKNMKNSNFVEDYIRSLFLYIDELKIFNQHEKFIDELKEKKLFEKVIENTQIWNRIVEVINQLAEISGKEEMDIKDFYNLLETGFSEISLGIIPSNDDSITIGSFSRSKLSSVKCIFVCGANDGILPSSTEEYGLLMDEDKKILENGGFNLKSSMNFRATEEEYNIYQNISKARDKIIFSYSCFNLSGGSIKPSIYIGKLKKIFPEIIEEKHLKKNIENLNFLYGGYHEILKVLIESMKKLFDGEELSFAEKQLIKLIYKDKRDIYDKILGYLQYTNIPEKLDRNYVDSLYKLPLTGSVSKLEKYANCPFSYFVRYGLRPEERKYYTVELPDIGIIFHNSLEKFGREVFSKDLNWRDIDRDMSDKMAEEIVDGIVSKYYDKVFLSTNSNKYLINKIKRVVKRSVWVTSNQLRKGRFDPKAFEIEFSDSLRDDVVPPIVIDIDGKEKIYLEGRIDRLDLVDIDGKKYARIIDYKSSDKKYSLSDVFNGLQMQLMIYMNAVIENSSYFRESEIYPGGVFYFKIDDPLIESNERRLEIIEDEIIKRLKLEGIVVDDINVIEAVDENIMETKNSEIVSVKLNSSGLVRKDSQTISLEDFEKLMVHVKDNIADIGSNIISGDISILPVKNGDKKACDYCKYSEICQFDDKIKDNKYKRVKKYSDDEVIEKISGKVE